MYVYFKCHTVFVTLGTNLTTNYTPAYEVYRGFIVFAFSVCVCVCMCVC